MARRSALSTSQVPLWNEATRGLPLAFVQSALFCVGSRSARRHFQGEVIASYPGTKITYTGEELRTDDEEVLMQILHMVRGCKADANGGLEIGFSGLSLLRELDWGTSVTSYERLKAALTRLQNGSLSVQFARDGHKLLFSGQLLRKFMMADTGDRKQQWHVWLEPEVVKLFHPIYLEIQWSERMRLRRPIAKWLHGFMANEPDDEVFVVPEAEIKSLSGTQTSSKSKFRQLLKEALEELREEKLIAEWKIHQDMLYIAKKQGLDINRATKAYSTGNQLELEQPQESTT